PWTSHLLPAAAARLVADRIAERPDSADLDFSEWLLVVRGRAASRRLLASLATEAQRNGRALIPPRIVTQGSIDDAIFGGDPCVAHPLIQRIAWTVVVQEAGPERIERIWTMPGGRGGAANLAGVLDRTWRVLSTSGVDFIGAFAELAKIAPDSADFEEERWESLQHLLAEYRAKLDEWGFVDPSARRARLASTGRPQPDLRVALIGVVELPPEFVLLLRALPVPPLIFIHAPESEADGFDEWGRLNAAFWAKRPCIFSSGEIHVVRGVQEQAVRCAELIREWKSAGLAESGMTIAAPEPTAIPALLHGLADAGIKVRSAEGLSTSRTSVVQLLAQVAEFLDRPAGAPPTYTSVAALARHPDLAGITRNAAEHLDEYFNDHLPLRIELRAAKPGVNEERVADLLERLENVAAIRSTHFSEDVAQLLIRIYRHHHPSSQSEAGRALHAALEAVRGTLDEIEHLPRKALAELPVSELLRILVESAGKGEVPEPDQDDAVELAGWLEAAADDAPALIVTSVVEGALPEGAPVEPLLLDALRQHLGLPCRASRFARDQYTLHTVWMSRREHGRIALLAPRRTAEGLPARPSRLLLGAQDGDALARRLISLTTEARTATVPIHSAAGLVPPEPDLEKMRGFRVFSVTSFRSYIRSPRLFYFKNILGLGAQDDSADELDPAMFGTAIHTVLQEFGERHIGHQGSIDPAQIAAELGSILEDYMQREFGPHALPPVRAQSRALEARLGIFANHQASLFAEGWQIAYVEKDRSLVVPFPIPGGPQDVRLKGRIDRIDRHTSGKWRVIDYKTSSQAVTPDRAHFGKRSGEWKDLQLPLYVKLLPELRDIVGGPISEKDDVDLVYFNLSPKSEDAGITKPFTAEKIPGAWEKARQIVTEICSGAGCVEIGEVADNEDPAFLALCGLNGLPIAKEEE
ncbi:MAG: PD-(D/E)XK nuclease family protein, partial [Chthoniobacteraceae bacterium]